jgi:2-polyprenyl-6-methoxyphenol hydroxylase-like FAD-dependent oxidoreductase
MRSVIVGAGPTGLYTAVALARRGHQVTVIDRLRCEFSPDGGRMTIGKRQRARMLSVGKDLAEVLRHLGIAGSAWKHAGGTSTAG